MKRKIPVWLFQTTNWLNLTREDLEIAIEGKS